MCDSATNQANELFTDEGTLIKLLYVANYTYLYLQSSVRTYVPSHTLSYMYILHLYSCLIYYYYYTYLGYYT